jgi:hypothetical protein
MRQRSAAAGGLGGRRVQDGPRLLQRRGVGGEACATRRVRRRPARRRLAEVEFARPVEVRREGDVEQPALAARLHLRHAAERGGDRALGRDQAQPPGAFRDEEAPVRQQRRAPGPFEPRGEVGDAEGRAFAADDVLRLGGQGEEEKGEEGAHAHDLAVGWPRGTRCRLTLSGVRGLRPRPGAGAEPLQDKAVQGLRPCDVRASTSPSPAAPSAAARRPSCPPACRP